MTWPPRNLVPNANQDVSAFEEVTVIFPAANFPVGTNDAERGAGLRHARR